MPEYEFECTNPECACKFRVLYQWYVADGMNALPDPNMQDCIKCGAHADHLWSLATMRPDRFWHGVYVDTIDQYHTSESRYKEYLKKNELEIIGDRTDREGLEKQARQGMKEKEQKADKELNKILIDEVMKYDIHPSLESKENKEKRQVMEADHPEDITFDPAFAG